MKKYFEVAKLSIVIMVFCAFILMISNVLSLNSFGIIPRSTPHLIGILFAPFIHSNFAHLMSNFLPFVIFSCLISLHSINRFWLVFFFSIIITGMGVWIFARGDSVHIGMSGVIYAMWGYLIVYGIKQRSVRDIIISLLVLIFYGGLIWGVLPSVPNISYESHFFGALAGGLLASILANKKKI